MAETFTPIPLTESEVAPRPATISFIKQYARMCVPNLTDRLLTVKSMRRTCLGAMASLCLLFTGCSSDDPTTDPVVAVQAPGLLVLNEGSWGGNDARLDYLNVMTGEYSEGLYVRANPEVVKELGDVANDLQQFSGRLYAVVNGSHKVEIMNGVTCKRIGQVNVPSPRAIAFSGTKAYVTSWVDGDNDNGSVVEFDINTLQITRTISVGQEPEGIAQSGGKLYVACSGGMHTEYSNQVWVIDIAGFAVESKIAVAPNLHRCMADADGNVWVSSRGNYVDVSSGLYRISNGEVIAAGVPCAGFCIAGNTVYYYASEWSNATFSYTMEYGTLDRVTMAKGESFITDGTEAAIVAPYAIAALGDGTVFISDAKNYASSGALYVYTNGNRTHTHATGICPGSLLVVR